MNKNKILHLVKSALIKEINDNISHLLVYFKDVDHDEIDEIIARYVINNNEFTTVLKYRNYDWIIVNQDKIKLYPAYIHAVGGKKWGYINEKGKYCIKPTFNHDEEFKDELAIVQVDNLFGVINDKGEYIVNPIYENIEPFHENRAIVTLNNEQFIINERGEILSVKGYPYLGNFHDSRAVVKDKVNKEYLFGYLDSAGEVVIPIKYKEANDFNNHKAVVKATKYQLIDLEGNILQEYPYAYVGNYGEGRLVIKIQDKCGYINETGEVIINPQYQICHAYKDDYAIVNQEQELYNTYGLIDLEGKELFKPIYNHLIPLGEKRYAVGLAKNKNKPYLGILYAIGNEMGEFLTDFKYEQIKPYYNHLASATKNNKTFFIDLNGEIIESLPILSGVGSLQFMDHIIQANIDHELHYIDDEGQIINYPNYIIPINDSLDVVTKKYKPNKQYLVYYPKIEKIGIHRSVNKKLKQLSRVKEVPTHIQYEYYGDFTVLNLLNNLLQIKIEGYKYQYGAAHGFSYQEYAHIDIETGIFYQLFDLFKEQCDYHLMLTNWVIEHKRDKHTLIDEMYIIKEDPLFFVDTNHLHIVFKPYEVAPYSEGYITFSIPFSSIMNCIDINNDFWKSFHN
ncbi:WG repeat-containing protein [Mycoplasmatota bacterium]|nr:WG repeat-containing protein [Mycoplasmatota bacterium]